LSHKRDDTKRKAIRNGYISPDLLIPG